MRILADENLARVTVETLRTAGHDVEWIREGSPGISDIAVAARAVATFRVVLTLDQDFGDLVFHQGIPHRGVISIRIPTLPLSEITDIIITAVARIEEHLLEIGNQGAFFA